MFLCNKDICHHISPVMRCLTRLDVADVWSIFAHNMFAPFILVLRQQQQLMQVTVVMSTTITVGEQKNIIITALDYTIFGIIENRDSQMKVKRMKKAPRSIGLALGRPCSLTHILLRRFSASSRVSILA